MNGGLNVDDQIAIPCSLTTGELGGRRERWRRLSERAMIATEPIGAGVRLRFRPLDGIEDELHELVALERGCCSFAAWSAYREAGQLVLDATAAGAGVDAVRALFEELPAAGPGAQTPEDSRETSG